MQHLELNLNSHLNDLKEISQPITHADDLTAWPRFVDPGMLSDSHNIPTELIMPLIPKFLESLKYLFTIQNCVNL